MDEANKSRRDWEKLLDRQTLRTNLMLASLYLTAYELLHTTVVDRIRCFFVPGFVDGLDDQTRQDEYQEVRQLNKNPFLASCQWLEQNGTVSADDLSVIKDIKHHRNEIAHELPNLLSDVDREISFGHLHQIRHLLRKIGIWWARNVHLVADPDFDGVEVRDEDIHPGTSLVLAEIIRIALENEPDERESPTN